MKDERYQQIMKDIGMENSLSLLVALKQVANEVGQEMRERCAIVGAREAEKCDMPDGQRVADAIRKI